MQQLAPSDPSFMGGYPLLARLGAGGMGQVYLSRTPAGRPLALKTVRADLGHDPGFETRFAREIANSDRIRSPWSVTVVDFSHPGHHPQWLANEYVPAPSLSAWVTRHGPLPEPALRALAAELCGALRAVGQVGLTHRDVKPGNILLARDRPRLIDFGIARAVDESRHTQTGSVIGSPGYLAPEQVTHGETAPSSDVFSLAAVLTFAATGRGPFSRPDETVPSTVLLYRSVHEEPVLDGVPEELLPALRAGLTKNPQQRPDAERWGEQLRRLGCPDGGWSQVLPEELVADISAHEQTVRTLLAAPAPQPTRTVSDRVAWAPGPSAPAPATAPAHVPAPAPAPVPAPAPAPAPVPAPAFVPTAASPERPLPPQPARRGVSRRWALLSVGGLTAAAAIGGTGWYLLDRSADPPEARVRWRYPVPGGWGGTFSPAAALSADGRTVYVGTGQGLHAVSSDGERRWEITTRAPASTPSVSGAGICFCTLSESVMYLLDPSGTRKWQEKVDGTLTTMPAVAGDAVWAGGIRPDETGFLESWATSGDGDGWAIDLSPHVLGAPVVSSGTVLYMSEGPTLRARDVATSEELWDLDLGSDLGLPAVSGDMLFVCSASAEQDLHGVTLDGEHVFTRPGRGGGRRTATVATRSLAFAVAEGTLRATDAQGRSRWTFEPPDGAALLANTATVAGDTVYVQGGESLYAVGLDGEPRWRVTTGEVGEGRGLRPVVRGRTVYVATARDLVSVAVRARA